MNPLSLVSHLAGLALLASSAVAQTPTLDIKDGDSLGFAALIGIGPKAVNDSGAWLTAVHTDFADLTADEALLRSDGSIALREGDLLNGLPIVGFVWQELDSLGRVTTLLSNHDHFLRGSTVLWNGTTVVDYLLQVPGEDPGVVYSNTYSVRANDLGTVLVHSSVATRHRMMLLHLDPSGNVLSAETPLVERGFVSGNPDPILALVESHNGFDLNNRGEWMTSVATGDPITGWNMGTGLVLVNGTIVAQEGLPSPVPGRLYETLFPGSEVALNDFGDYAFTATLDGSITSDFLLVVNGAKYVQDGDVLPALAPFALAVASGAPIVLTNSSDLYWFAETNNPDETRDRAFMRNREVIVQEGSTTIGGQTVMRVSSADKAFAVSPGGRFWIGEVELQGGIDAQIAADFGAAVPIPGCESNPGSLRLAEGLVLVGQTIALELDGAPAVGTLGMLSFSLAAAGGPCGLVLPVGELLIDPGQIVAHLPAGAYLGAPMSISIAIPNDPALVDLVGYAQGLFLDADGSLPGPDITLTNGLRLEIGAP